jgi:hypothetical protein
MAKRAKSIPMVTQPVRSSDAHPMAEAVPAQRRRAGLNNVNPARNDRLRRDALKKQRALLAGDGKK